ncbi:MAG TPA: hypothetical protein VIP11_24005 [Gemmatimonadaceae bacterium]
MWSAIQWLVVRIAAVRWLFKLGWLGFLIPIVLILKTIGLPILAALSIVAVPLLILLVLFGLPIFLVLIFGSLFMGFLGFVFTIGVAALKFALFVVLPVWLLWKVACAIFHWGRKGGGDDGSTKPSTPTDSTGGTTSGPTGDSSEGLGPA